MRRQLSIANHRGRQQSITDKDYVTKADW